MSEIREDDLFDNPMVKAAAEKMSEEDKERYKRLGESMYLNVDFNESKVLDNTPAPMAEAVAYLSEAIKSGLHPSMLNENEQAVLKELYGTNWYENFGYVEADLTAIVTIKKN